MYSIGDRIKYIRTVILKDKTQSELAELLGVKGKAVVSHWESNTSIPEVYTLMKLADMAGVTIDWIMKGDKAPPGMVEEPAATEYKVRQLEQENNELKEENEILRSKLGTIASISQAVDQIKYKKRK
jgi:transcriptional regulator with XRE-family HTH domain